MPPSDREAASTDGSATPDEARAGPAIARPATTLVGRDHEVAELGGLIQANRLVTLTGPGGAGKTRLAMAVAQSLKLEGERLDIVDVAAADRVDIVLPTILSAMGLHLTAEARPADLIANHIGDTRHILLLDSFEHVVGAGPEIAELLSRCPGLTALVTSRVVLRLSGERIYEVPPLSVPAESAPPETLLSHGSVRLFVERALEAGAPETIATQLPEVAAACRRLEGMPLAIELAAARTRHLSIQALLRRLDEPLPILTGGPIDAPPRHRALRHTIAWSYELLDTQSAAFFARLGVFAGGFTGAAARLVAGDSLVRTELEALDRLSELADHSLIRSVDGSGTEPRFDMHDTIGDFAVTVIDDEPAARTRHLAWFVDLTERAEPELDGPEQAEWMRTLTAELENLRAALGWAERSGATLDLLRLAVALGDFWRWHGDLAEGKDWLSRAVAAAPSGHDALIARAERRLGRIYSRLGDRDQARRLYESAREHAELAQDSAESAAAMVHIGASLVDDQRQPEAADLIDQGLELARLDGNARVLADALLAKAMCEHYFGATAPAAPFYQETVEVALRAGNVRVAGVALANLANARFAGEDYRGAVPLLTEAISYLDEVGDLAYSPWAYLILGLAHRKAGDLRRAKEALDRGARLAFLVGSPEDMIFACEAIADWLGAVGAHREAILAWAAAGEAHDRHDVPRQPVDDPWIDDGIERDRGALPPADAAAAWSAGEGLQLRAALEAASTALRAPVAATTSRPKGDRTTLTKREQEVLALLTQGHSDGEIAERLFISPKTASVHVANVKGKLQATSRVDIVMRAIRMGLVDVDDQAAE